MLAPITPVPIHPTRVTPGFAPPSSTVIGANRTRPTTEPASAAVARDPRMTPVACWGLRDRGVGEHAAEPLERGRRRAERELELLREQEVAVQRVVAVDADAAVQVVRGVHDALRALARPRTWPIATCSRAGSPVSSRHAACHAVSRTASVSMYASAARWLTAWNVAIGRPNCSRVFVYSAVSSSAVAHAPDSHARTSPPARAARSHVDAVGPGEPGRPARPAATSRASGTPRGGVLALDRHAVGRRVDHDRRRRRP